MTRMLCSILAMLFCISMLNGCSLFNSDDERISADQMGSQTVSGNEALDELADLGSDDLGSNDLGSDDFGSDDPVSNDLGSDDFGSEDLGSNDLESDNFGSDDFSDGDSNKNDTFAENESDNEFDDLNTVEDPFSEQDLEAEFSSAEFDQDNSFSDTDDNNIDSNLAENELNQFGEDEFSFEDELAGQPVTDVPDQGGGLVDIPQDGKSLSNQVTNLEYKSFENGGTVVIQTSSPADYQTIEKPELNQIIIQINDVDLPQRFKRPYITKDFKQDIATINGYSDPATSSAKFVIQLKRPMKPIVQKEGNSILVMTEQGPQGLSEHSEVPLDQLVAENQFNLKSQTKPAVKPKVQADPRGEFLPHAAKNSNFANSDSSGALLNSGRFVGEKISLEFKDTDVRTIIEVIAEKSGVNLIMDNEVSGNTSLRLRDVPWDQALLVTLRSQGLGYVKQGNVLRIAKQATLSQEASAVSQQIKNEKEAQLLSGGLKVKYVPISYAKVSELATKLTPFTSKEGKIAFDDRTSSLVITDYGEYIERVLELIRSLDTAPMQVEIAAKLVEAREEFLREAGINWSTAGSSFAMNTQSGSLSTRMGGSVPTNGFSLDLDIGTFDIFGDLTAALGVFETQAKIKVLSQPKIVTMNKTKATIKQVTQIPILSTTLTQGVSQEQVTFQDLVLSLDVTPQITFNGDVILEVDLKREFAGVKATDGTRELNKRNATTTVMVKNGKTAVIGGIYQLVDTDNDQGLPWLKDIPLIGYLFKQTSVQKSKNELLLFLKPKILKETQDIEMLSKVDSPVSQPDAFQELSADEEADQEPVLDIPVGTDSMENELMEDFPDEGVLEL